MRERKKVLHRGVEGDERREGEEEGTYKEVHIVTQTLVHHPLSFNASTLPYACEELSLCALLGVNHTQPIRKRSESGRGRKETRGVVSE